MASRPRTRSNKGLTSPGADVESVGAKDGGTGVKKSQRDKTRLVRLCYVVIWMFCNFFFSGMDNHQTLLAFMSFPPYFDVCVNFIWK